MKPNVFTYYSSIPGLYSEDSQWKLIDVWARSWDKAGWNPVVLNEKHLPEATRNLIREKFLAHPTEYGDDYTLACYARWFVVAHQGGGMLTDYDVINYGFEPRHPPADRMIIFCDDPPPTVFMGAVLGTREHFEKICKRFLEWEFKPEDTGAQANWWYYNDLMMLERLFETKHHDKPAWFVKENGCALFDYPSCRDARLVHYGYRMHDFGYWPKYQWIEKIRPF